MKFIRLTTKAYLFLFILISSFLISIHTETKISRTNKRRSNKKILRSNITKRNLKHKIAQKDDDTMENGVKIFDFTLGILTCLPGIDEFAGKI